MMDTRRPSRSGSDGPIIPFHVTDITEADINAVVSVLRSGWLTTGPRVREFEEAFAAAVDARHAVALNSGTAALHLALHAVGLQESDEVIVPTMTFASTAEVVRYSRAVVRLVDCDPDTLTVRAEDIEASMGPRTRALMPVHFGGHPCDMDPILALARSRQVRVIEDGAHACPASYRGRNVGAIGDMTAFSFYATKTLTTGEGGMLTTDDDEYAARARMMSLHGISRDAWTRDGNAGSWRYDIVDAGFKYNMTDIAGALGLAQLRRAEELWQARARIAARYDAGLSDVPEVRIPTVREDVRHAWHLYTIRLRTERLRIDRDEFIEALRARGIGTSVHFIPLHLHPYYRKTLGYADGAFPNAEVASTQLISLPIYPRLRVEDVDRVVNVVTDLVRLHRR